MERYLLNLGVGSFVSGLGFEVLDSHLPGFELSGVGILLFIGGAALELINSHDGKEQEH